MQKLVQALPQFQDQLDKLSLHIHGRAIITKSVYFVELWSGPKFDVAKYWSEVVA